MRVASITELYDQIWQDLRGMQMVYSVTDYTDFIKAFFTI